MSVNQVFLIGRLGRDPDLIYAQSGKAIAKLRVATSQKWTDSGGKKHEVTDWHSCTAFGKQAEVIEKYVHKSDEIVIRGRLSYNETEKDGQKRRWAEVIIEQFTFVQKQGSVRGADSRGSGSVRSAEPARAAQPQHANASDMIRDGFDNTEAAISAQEPRPYDSNPDEPEDAEPFA